MAKPTYKASGLESLLEDIFGRSTAIKKDHCIPLPIGCGKPVTGFRDELSEKEYRISGLCQVCQDKVYNCSDSHLEEEYENRTHLEED